METPRSRGNVRDLSRAASVVSVEVRRRKELEREVERLREALARATAERDALRIGK